MIVAVIDPSDFVREPHLSWEFYPSWVMQELKKQGIKFKPTDRSPFHILTMEELTDALMLPWEITPDSLTGQIVVKQCPMQ